MGPCDEPFQAGVTMATSTGHTGHFCADEFMSWTFMMFAARMCVPCPNAAASFSGWSEHLLKMRQGTRHKA